jgi:outer membrane receptor for ferrienterochelin and colicins
MRSRIATPFLTLVLLLLASAGAASAQAGNIMGRVTDAASGQPLASTVVQALDATGQVAGSTLTDAGGTFRLVNLAPGTYTVRVTMTGYAAVSQANVTVTAGQTTSLVIPLTPTAFELNPIVVSASRRAERALDAPARVEVVGAEEIAMRPAQSATEHLRGVAGVDIGTTGVQSANIVTRGFNNIFSGALNVLTDHRIAGVPSLRVNLLHFIPAVNEDMERMEVVLGPGAALYGPNTANGVLHIFTRSPLVDPGTTFSITGGEQSLLHLTGRSSHRLNETFGVKVSGQFFQAREWENEDQVEQLERGKFTGAQAAFWRQDMMNAFQISGAEADARIARIGNRDFDVQRWSGELRADWAPNPDVLAVFSAGTTVSSGIELTGLGAGQAEGWRYSYYQARANWRELFGQIYLNASDAGETYLLRTGAPIVDRSRMLVGQLQHGAALGAMQRFTYGVDYIHTTPETEGTINGIYEDDDETTEIGAYVQSETNLGRMFDLVLAGRVDTHSALPEAIFSPRAALVFTPVEDHALRLTFNRAFSTPSSLNQFLDLSSSAPNPDLARLGYSIRVQGTGRHGFTIQQPDGSFLMRSPFTPQGAGGPAQLLPANATMFWPAAVQVVAAGAAAQGAPLNPSFVAYLASLAPTGAQISTMYHHPAIHETGTVEPLSALSLPHVDPIRESISNTIEFGYKGILGRRLLMAADVWWSRRENLVTPLTIQTPLLMMNGAQIVQYLVPRFMQDLGMSQEQATATAMGLAPNLASVPLGVVSAPGINANGAQLLVTYVNVDESIDLWGSDLSATAILTDRFSLNLSASIVSDDMFETQSGMVVALNAPKQKGSIGLAYRDMARGQNAEARVRHTAGYPVSSGVYQATQCIVTNPGPDVEPCIAAHTLVDLTLGSRLPGVQRATLQLNVQNLFDVGYRSFPGSPEIGRMAMLRLRYDF